MIFVPMLESGCSACKSDFHPFPDYLSYLGCPSFCPDEGLLGKTDSRFCGDWGADHTAHNKLESDHIAGSDCNLSDGLFLLCLFSRLVAELDKVWSFACKTTGKTEYQNKWLDIKREYVLLRGRDQRDFFPFSF